MSLNKETSLENLMTNFPKAIITTNLEVANYDVIISNLDILNTEFEKLIFEKIENDNEFFNLKKIEKGIKALQEDLKQFLGSLDNEKIEILRDKSNKLLKVLGQKAGKTQGNIGFVLDEYKKNKLENIITISFDTIKSYEEYPSDFDLFYKDCIDGIKGKSSFDEIQNICLKIAENHSFKNTMLNTTYLQYFLDLKTYCIEIGYIIEDQYLKSKIKNAIKGNVLLNDLKIEIEKENESQKIIIAERIEKERIEKERIEKERIEKENNNIKKVYIIEIFSTETDFLKYKKILLDNNCNFKIKD